MEMQTANQPTSFEQTLINVVRVLPTFQRTQLLDFALILSQRMIATAEAKAIIAEEALDERLWGGVSVRSLAKYWDTPEEDEAWAYLQKATKCLTQS
jgi:hypothetical protein